MKPSSILSTIALAALAPAASAAILASDDFNYAPGALTGQSGGSGWSGAWTANSVATVVDPAVDLSGSRALQFAGNHNNAAYRTLGSSFGGAHLYIGFLAQVAQGSVTANDFVSLWLDNIASGDHTTRPNIGIKADRGTGTPGDDVFARTTGTAGGFVSGSNLAGATTYRVVGHLYKSSSANYNRFDLWLDPAPGDAGSPEAGFSGDSGIGSVSMVGFRSANLDAGDRVLIDQLTLGTSWNDVLAPDVGPLRAVPEPGTLALGIFAAAGLLLRRRRTG